MYLKSQDVLVLLKLSVWGDRPWRQEDLAGELGMVQSQVHASLKRADVCGLYDFARKRVNRLALVELLIYSVRFLIPGRFGVRSHGIPTAWGHREAFASLATGVSEPPVWSATRKARIKAKADGLVSGVVIEPLHEKAPAAALQDPKLYELLAAVDALRVGRAREMEMARDILKRRILAA